MPEVTKDLRKISKMWAQTESRTFGSGLSDDDYIAELISMEVGKSKKMRLQVASKFRVLKGPSKGSEFTRFDGIENENNVAFFKGYCEVIGCELPEDSEDLQASLEDFVDKNEDSFEVKLVTNKEGFQNVQVQGVAGGTTETDDTPDEPEGRTGKTTRDNGKRRR